MIRLLVESVMRRSLARAFRRVSLVGDASFAGHAGPVVLYANHHVFHDGFLLWLLLSSHGRRAVTWMQEWDRVPIFAPAGALPFPVDDAARRSVTVRTTARRFAERPDTGLIWFPEGRLHDPAEGILPFDGAVAPRMHRILGRPAWAAATIRIAWTTESRPTALLSVSALQDGPDGSESERLANGLQALAHADPRAGRVLLDGGPGPEERWPLDATRGFFSRYL